MVKSPKLSSMGANKRSSRNEDNWRLSTPSSSEEQSPMLLADKCSLLEEFINISFTPVECSIICPTEIIDILFGAEIALISKHFTVSISNEEYLAMQVDGDGQEDVGSRVLNLSAPLSSAGIPIFFIATYFSDYVLVPATAKAKVIAALEKRSFVFSDVANSYIALDDPKSPLINGGSFMSPHLAPVSPGTSQKAFALFEQHSVTPHIDENTKLLLTGARGTVFDGPEQDAFSVAILKILINPPKYFSLTVQNGSEVSFLINSETSKVFAPNTLLGSPTDYVIPICFDLRTLPEDATGIVSGVASRLLDNEGGHEIHMSYLSTAKSSVVLVSEEDLQAATTALENTKSF